MKYETVVVINTSNYKSSYSDKVPFKAQVLDRYDDTIWVVSEETNKEYELYYDQILEFYSDDQLSRFIDVSKYGL